MANLITLIKHSSLGLVRPSFRAAPKCFVSPIIVVMIIWIVYDYNLIKIYPQGMCVRNMIVKRTFVWKDPDNALWLQLFSHLAMGAYHEKFCKSHINFDNVNGQIISWRNFEKNMRSFISSFSLTYLWCLLFAAIHWWGQMPSVIV